MENNITNSRQVAFNALLEVYYRGAYTDVALDRILTKTNLPKLDRNLVCELVYGIVRRQRTLDSIIDRLGKKSAAKQPHNLRIILHLGLYQLRYLQHIPPSAAINTSVQLAKENGQQNLSGVVNGLLRQYQRLAEQKDPLELTGDSIEDIGIFYSFPDWIANKFVTELGIKETKQLLDWFNQPPQLDLRVNTQLISLDELVAKLTAIGIAVTRLPHLPQALRLTKGVGAIKDLIGYHEGWWIVQDSSAQLVTHLLAPQAGEFIIDACAAPGGKTTHIAEIMGDKGEICAIDRTPKRLQKVTENATRLRLKSIQTLIADSRTLDQFTKKADRVLLDAPCSGLGTLHKRPDLRWRQESKQIRDIIQLQRELLDKCSTWVKDGGILVYSTCTLDRDENEAVIEAFLESHPNWKIEPPTSDSPANAFTTSDGWIKILPHQHQMDGFFMARLRNLGSRRITPE
jgi:16S rRNA (cytosine967-C5)-methyltransferase